MADAEVIPINYVELGGGDLPATKGFYAAAFGWSFTDYGPEYAAMTNAGPRRRLQRDGERPPLVILKADDLEAVLARVQAAGAEITAADLRVPGGRRFHFRDPAGNELAVWAE